MASLGIDPALLAILPALQPPDGVKPNFTNPESRADQTRIVIYICLPIMLCFVCLRVYTRLRVTRQFGADDYLCIVAAALVVVWCSFVLSILGHPLGPHQWNVPLVEITTRFVKNSLSGICVCAIAAIFVKCTLLVLYLRLFSPSRAASWAIWAGIGMIVSFYVSTMVGNIVLCYPHKGDGGWLSVKSQTRCGQPALRLAATQGTFSALSDFYVLCIPLKLIWGLQLPSLRKLGVCAIFLTGLLACACSTLGLVYRFQEVNSPDFTWSSIPVYSLSAVELNTGIICSCMPVVFVVFKGFSQTLSQQRYIKYLRSKTRWATETASRGPEEGQVSTNQQENYGTRQPPFLSLKSFIFKPLPSHRQPTQANSYTELESLADEYHAQLKPRRMEIKATSENREQ